MPRACSVCAHSNRKQIDSELAGGGGIRGIARKYRVSEDAISRHRSHLAEAVVRAAERKGERIEDSLLDQIQRLTLRAWSLLDKLEGEGDLRGAVIGLRETRETLTALNELLERAAPGGSEYAICEVCRREFLAAIDQGIRNAAKETSRRMAAQSAMAALPGESDGGVKIQ